MTGSMGDSDSRDGSIDEGEASTSIGSPGGILGSGAADWPRRIDSPGTIGWSRMAGCVGTVDGLVIGPAAAIIEGFGYWKAQS